MKKAKIKSKDDENVGQVFKNYLVNKCFCKLGNFGTLIIYIIGIFLNWRQLAAVCILCGIPYVLGLILCLPNDFPYQNLSRMKSYTTEKLVDEDSSDLMYNKVSIYFYLFGNNQCGNCRIFLPFRFYVKSISVRLE